MKPQERERLQYIHDCVKNNGYVRVCEVKNRFGVTHPTASKAVKMYRELAPFNIEFDYKSMRYFRLETFVDIEIPEVVHHNIVLVHVVEADRALGNASNHKHREVYRAGLYALGLKGE